MKLIPQTRYEIIAKSNNDRITLPAAVFFGDKMIYVQVARFMRYLTHDIIRYDTKNRIAK